MCISKLKLGWSLLTGGRSGCIRYLLDAFNKQVLARISSKEQAAVCLRDINAVTVFVGSLFENHSSSFSEEKKAAFRSLFKALNYLSDALTDFVVDESEFSDIVLMVGNAIQDFRKASK